MDALQGYTGYIEELIEEWRVPGLAIGILHKNEIIYAQGFGKRDLAADLPVTPDTIFGIGSCSKAFTTLLLAMLVDEGKLDWDTPVRSYLPWFRMLDPFASERISARDFLTHRSGLPRHDFITWYDSAYSRREIVERLRYLEPTRDFRSTYQYTNILYTAAGYLAGEIAASSWEELLQERIFTPLSMQRSLSSLSNLDQFDNVAKPYAIINDQLERIPYHENPNALAPAAGVYSSVSDLLTWLALHMNRGMYNQRQIVSNANVSQLYSPIMALGQRSRRFTELGYSSYGLGWDISTYRGQLMIGHDGSIDGFMASIRFLPDVNTGIVILANLHRTRLLAVPAFSAFDRLLNLPRIDWNTRYKALDRELAFAQEHLYESIRSNAVSGTLPSRPLANFCGEYVHAGYGTISVTHEENQLYANYHQIRFSLSHSHYDVFLAESVQGARSIIKLFNFISSSSGSITRLEIQMSLSPELEAIAPEPTLFLKQA